MTTHITKTWFVDGQIIEQEIPESEIYLQHWSIDGCKAYAVQLRDKTRANTAAHAADAIEYLLSQAPSHWASLTDGEAQQTFAKHNCTISTDLAGILARAIEAKLKEKNI